jgi:hypothetical protein
MRRGVRRPCLVSHRGLTGGSLASTPNDVYIQVYADRATARKPGIRTGLPRSQILRSPAEACLSKKQWAGPESDWLPIGLGTFKFGMSEGDEVADVQQKRLLELSRAEILQAAQTPFSLDQLTELLEKTSGVHEATIDQEAATLSCQFKRSGGGLSTIGGAPWAILREQRTSPHIHPRVEAEALFSKEGLVRIGDEEAQKRRDEFVAVREATRLVWRRLMLGAFDRAVTLGRIVLYARRETVSAGFDRLPPDAWPLLEVIDWQNGVAVTPDGCTFWSLHAQGCKVSISSRQDVSISPGPRRVRGRRPDKRQAVIQLMKTQIEKGELTLPELKQMKELALAVRYGIGRDTARKARNHISLELSANLPNDN